MLRRGFKAALNRVFDAARVMTGSLHPDDMGPAREEVAALRKELFAYLESVEQQREVLAALLKASEKFWTYVNVYSDPVLEHEATLALHRARNTAHKVLGTKMPELDWHDHLQQFVPKKDRA